MPKSLVSCLGAALLVVFMPAPAATPDPHHAAKASQPGTVHPALWPIARSPVARDRATERRIDALLATMTVEEKVGQVIQPEWKTITPAEVITYHIGSIENGGGAVPGGNKHASVQDWVNLIDPYWKASVDAKNHVRIPLLWVSDAVHGHNNVYGATLFPHNVGLGAAHDPGLIRRIGEVTAAEVRSTGMDWSFSPTIAVARDDRWGRSYESYSEDPKIVMQYAAAMIKGLQGEGRSFLDQEHVLATAKHFLGDGSTAGGRDQGDSLVPEAELARLHGAAYASAIDAGVQSIMASYNSWHGTRMHANKALLTDILKDHMGFDGILTGDWLAHGQIPGCSNSDCPTAFNAGLDLFNQPQDWKQMHSSLVREVGDGTIPMARLDDAVRRILRVKFRMGAFDALAPKDRATTLRPIGTPAHRAVAREAVAKSLVLLKNNDQVLPLKAGATVLVAGDGANNIAMQAGGWTLSWQGADNGPQDFPGATSIYDGLQAQLEAGGGKAQLAPDGRFTSRPDVAVVVFGESPYAEFMGDQADVALHHDNEESLAILKRLKAAGIPTVAVLLSGRPLYVNPQLNAADAFVAAWLPGSEGAGIADVLTGKRDFTGRLAFSWPRRPDQTPLNVGDAHYDPQFPYGYGLSYAARTRVPMLVEVAGTVRYGAKNVYLTGNDLWNGYGLSIGDSDTPRSLYAGTQATLGSAALAVEPAHDGVHVAWAGRHEAWLEVAADAPSDIAREANGAMMLSVRMAVHAAPGSAVTMGIGAARLDVTSRLAAGETTLAFPLSCFKAQDLAKTPSVLRLATAGTLDITLEDVRLTETRPGAACPDQG